MKVTDKPEASTSANTLSKSKVQRLNDLVKLKSVAELATRINNGGVV